MQSCTSTAFGTIGGATNKDAVSLADLLERRTHGLTEPETWALLCQAVQALQDLFLSDSCSVGRCVPLVTPGSFLVTARGRVCLPTSRRLTATAPQTAYLAPEYRPGKNYTDTESEKMWIFSLGETLTRTALTSHCAVTHLTPALCRALSAMTRRNPAHRANLMCLLDVISDYCKSRVQTKPFSHIVMDLHREVMGPVCPVYPSTYYPTTPVQPSSLQQANVQSSPSSATSWGTLPRHHRQATLTRSPEKMSPMYETNITSQHRNEIPKYLMHSNINSAHLPSHTFSQYSQPNIIQNKNKTTNNTTNNNNNNNYASYETISNQLSKFNARTLEMNRNTLAKFSNNFNNNPFNEIDTKLKINSNSYKNNNENVQKNQFGENDDNNEQKRIKPRNPIQRAASRLYKAGDEPTVHRNTRNPAGCIGPEFVVRASLPNIQLEVGDCKPSLRKSITVILLNGQKLNILCDPNTTTAGQIFEAVIQSQNLKENFMLGLSALMSGDFIFLPSDTRVCKVATSNQSWSNLTLFLRIRLFLPSLRGLRGYQARHALYLQLRRSVLEQQLPCSIKHIITLGGLALQAEFGDFRDKEHGTTDYFLLEHYVPETMLNESSSTTLRELLTKAHKNRYGTERDRAEQEFIQHAQSLPHYGGHFYAAIWVTKESQNNVWLCVTARGISLYDRIMSEPLTINTSPCQVFEWRTIQTLCYSKQFLCILPHSGGKHSRPSKCKLKMDHKKSYFTFRLASLHHQFFLRLRTEYSSLQSLAQEFGIPLKEVKNETNTLCKINPISNDQDTQFKISYRTSSVSSHGSSENNKQQKCRRSKSATEIRLLNENMQLEEFQNKENENPQKQFGSLTRDCKNALVLDSSLLSGVPIVPSLGRERRHGVLMGTRAIGSSCTFQPSDTSHPASLEPLDRYTFGTNSAHSSPDEQPSVKAYVLNSSIKPSNDKFLPDFHETISDSLMEKFNKLSFVEERVLRSVTLTRNEFGSLGLQITEGSDGNVYVQSVIPNGPADKSKCIKKGDQIVAADGQSLINMKYEDALNLLKHTGKTVEFVLSQISQQTLTPRKLKARASRSSELFKSCSQLNSNLSMEDEKVNTSLHNSCFDISHIGTSSSCSLLHPDDKNIDISKINYVDFSETFHRLHSPERSRLVMRKSDSLDPTYPYAPENNYLKHIRYETTPEVNGIYSYTLTKRQKSSVCSPRISKSCGTLNDPKIYVREFDNIDIDPITSPDHTDNKNTATAIELIPKISKSLEDFLYRNVDSEYIDDTMPDDLVGQNNNKVAVPRSLGLSRKWKGPVRYPVTPARSNRRESFGTSEDDATTYTVTSDDEQVFI